MIHSGIVSSKTGGNIFGIYWKGEREEGVAWEADQTKKKRK